MLERSTVAQGIQIGVESVEGVAVPANKRLTSISLVPRPNWENSSFRPDGLKFPTMNVVNREWTTVALTGYPTYTEIVYPLAMVFGAPTITTPEDFVTARLWTFEISAAGADPAQSVTIERGDSNLAERAAGAVLNALQLGFSRTSDPTLSGDGFGRIFETGKTLTPGATGIPLVPILPKQICVYLDEADEAPEDAFGTTKLTRVYNGGINLGSRFANWWALDCAQESYVASVETPVSATVNLGVMANSDGIELLTKGRQGTTLLLRFEAKGAVIDPGVPESAYRLTIDVAAQITSPGDMGDQDGAMVLPYEGSIVFDPTWAKAIRVEVVNNLTSL